MRKTPLLALLALVACSGPTAPELADFQFFRDQTFDYHAVPRAGNQLVMEGTIRTPCAPYEVHAEISIENHELTLEVIGEDEDGNCPQDIVGALGYRATLSGLHDGLVRVRIIHRWADAAWPIEEPFTTAVWI
jgi:hypothetical protein